MYNAALLGQENVNLQAANEKKRQELTRSNLQYHIKGPIGYRGLPASSAAESTRCQRRVISLFNRLSQPGGRRQGVVVAERLDIRSINIKIGIFESIKAFWLEGLCLKNSHWPELTVRPC